jgi:arabinofuranosyltransferase
MAVLQNNQYIKKSNICYSIILVSLLLLIILLGKTAWLCDDAMITFRTVLQFTHGNGLVFNLGDRVQGYTHPLWMLVLTFNYWINQEIFISTMHLGIVLRTIG